MCKKSILLLSLLSLSLIAADFWKAGTAAPKELPADGIYPTGQQMMFSGYSPIPRDYERVKASGFNTFGPIYHRGFETFLQSCEKLGVYCIFGIAPKPSEDQLTAYTKDQMNAKDFDFDKLRQQVMEIVQKNAASEKICAWNIQPEELRFWYKNEMRYLEVVSKAVHDADPKHRPVFMYSPGHGDGNRLVKELAQGGDIIAQGCYVNYSGCKHQRIRVKWTMTQAAKAKAQFERQITTFLLPEMFQKVPDEEKGMIGKWVRHDVYCGVVNGAQGVLVYSLFPRAGLDFDTHFEAYSRCAKELQGGLGRVFLFGEKRGDIAAEITAGPQEVSCKLAGNLGEYTSSPLSMANIAYGNERYLFMVNSAEEDITLKLNGIPADAEIAPLWSDVPAMADKNAVILPPLAVFAYKITQKTGQK